MSKPARRVIEKNPQDANIILWDLESTNLNADFGYLLCFGYKRLGDKKAKAITITDFAKEFKQDPTNDRRVVEEAHKIISAADVIVTHYGVRFDYPLLSSRALIHGLPPLPRIPHVDTWWIARKNLKLHSNRLASVSAFLGVEEKTALSGPIWVKAAAGHKPSIKYVEEHCLQDVEVLEQAYLKLRAFFPHHPSLNAIRKDSVEVCPTCGSKKIHSRGRHVTKTGYRQRFQCWSCGAWCTGKKLLFSTELR